jgi:hypothetical protein
MSRRDFAESNTEFVDLAGISIDASASVRREGAAKGLFLDDEQADAGRDVDSGARLHTAYSIGGALRLLTKSALSSQQAWNSTQAPRCMGPKNVGNTHEPAEHHLYRNCPTPGRGRPLPL